MLKKIAFSPPDISDIEIAEVVDTLKSGWITTGPKTKLFELKIAQYCSAPKAACLNSATAGLELILRILGIGAGDEVITSCYTYTASASVICHTGATPVLVDVAKDSYQMDPDSLQKAITPKTKAVIAVDFAGIMCAYPDLIQLAKQNRAIFEPKTELQRKLGRIAIIADAAHAFGASANGVSAGSAADFTAFSFHAVKNLTTAEGGAVTWRKADYLDDGALYKEFMLASLHGQSKDALAKNQLGAWEYDVLSPAYKCNMTDITASLGLGQLRRFAGMLRRRGELIDVYDAELRNEPLQILQHNSPFYTSSKHLYCVRLPGKDAAFRNGVITALARDGVATNVHYKPLAMHTAYKQMGFRIEDFPNSYAMYQNEITLPLHTLLSDEDVVYVCDRLKKYIR